VWSAEELGEHWTLGAEDLALLSGLPDAGKLGLAAQLAYWRQKGRFPDEEADLAPAVVGHLAAQLGVQADVLECASLAPGIQNFATFETHETFVTRLRAKHGRKSGFWGQVTGASEGGSRR